MSIKTSQYPTGYVDSYCFERKDSKFFIYHSPLQHRDYELHYVKIGDAYQWNCNCPDARYISHKENKPCKHEIKLTEMQHKHAMRKAEQSEIAALRAEVASLRAEVRAASQAPDLTAIMAELADLRAENAEIKKSLACKATARKKHQSEQEAADIKRQINTVLDDAETQTENMAQAIKMVRHGLKGLEVIPHYLKSELDGWTETGKEELQPDYETPDYNAPEVKSLVRNAQEQAHERREATPEERRKMAPLNGNGDFSVLK